MSWFTSTLGFHAFACAAIILPSGRSTTDTQERNLELQSSHVLPSPETARGFPARVSMIPRRVVGMVLVPLLDSMAVTTPARPSVSVSHQSVALFATQTSHFVNECLYQFRHSASLSLTQGQLRYHVTWRVHQVDRVRRRCESLSSLRHRAHG